MCGLQFSLSFDKVVHEEMLTIPYGIGEEGNPFAKNEEARFTAEHEVKLDVAMPEDEVIDFGVLLR